MNENISILNQDAFTGDQDDFFRLIRKLLSSSCIVRNADDVSRRLYRYAIRGENMRQINEYLAPIHFRVATDGDGVLYLAETSEDESSHYGRAKFTRAATILIIVLGRMYREMEKDSVKDVIPVRMEEVHEYISKLGLDFYFRKNSRKCTDDALKELERYTLIKREDNKVSRESVILMYASLKHSCSEKKAAELVRAFADAAEEGETLLEDTNEELDSGSGSEEDDAVLRNQMSIDDIPDAEEVSAMKEYLMQETEEEEETDNE